MRKTFEASRQKDLTVITPFMQNEWEGFEQVSTEAMLQTYDTTFSKEKLTDIARVVSSLPEDKKFINKIKKIVSDREKMFFENDAIVGDWLKHWPTGPASFRRI